MRFKLIVIGVGVVAMLVAAYMMWPEQFGLCKLYDRGDGKLICGSPLGYPYGVSLLPFSIAFFALSVVAVITTRRTLFRWAVFSIGFFIVSLILLFTLPNMGYGMGGFGFSLVSVDVLAQLLAKLYAGISLVLFVISELFERRKKPSTSSA